MWFGFTLVNRSGALQVGPPRVAVNLEKKLMIHASDA